MVWAQDRLNSLSICWLRGANATWILTGVWCKDLPKVPGNTQEMLLGEKETRRAVKL